MSEVAIVGIGMHNFGRSPGLSGLDQGANAVREALQDAGLSWKDIQVAYGGSQDAGNADALCNQLGLTALQFTNIWNGCATGGSSLSAAYNAIKSGSADVALAVGFDKHEPGAFNADPKDWGLDDWYGEAGLMVTTQFFAMKIQRYMHDYGISESTLAKVAEKAFINGALNPKAIVFYAAVLPQFIDRDKGQVTSQLILLGAIFSILAFFSDGTWGLLAGTARAWLATDSTRLEKLRAGGGTIMILLGLSVLYLAIVGG